MEEQTNPRVVLETTLGKITIELDKAKAPVTVENFLSYVSSGFFDGTVFHRVIPELHDPRWRIQRGHAPEADQRAHPERSRQRPEERRGVPSPWRAPPIPHSATAQFFINLKDNDFLDHTSKTSQGWGYAVFGKVTDGMGVVDTIAQVKTGAHGPHRDVPADAIAITKAVVEE